MALLVLAQIVTYRYLALFLGRWVLGIREDTGYAILGYVVLRVLPLGLLFLAVAIAVTVSVGLKRPELVPFTVGAIVVADLLLLTWSVSFYDRVIVAP